MPVLFGVTVLVVWEGMVRGLDVFGASEVTGNVAWGQRGSGDIGIRGYGSAHVHGNVAWGNWYGFSAGSGLTSTT